MYNKHIKKTVFTLNVDNYAPDITAITYPLLESYAKRIGADFHIIKDRKFPDMPPVYEKLQIYELAQEMENDWNIYLDGDAVVHPETIDFTQFIPKDTVTHNWRDNAPVRWDTGRDRFFLRDGRRIGSGNWFTIASDQCIELWKPLDDLTYEEALAMIHPTNEERVSGVQASHLIDDFTLSRNIAKYGLKFKTIKDLLKELDLSEAEFFYHQYLISNEAKLVEMKEILKRWKI